MGLAQQWNVVIIGGGIAGLSAAIWARRLGLSTLVLEQAAEAGGQLRSIVQPIVDYPGLEGATGAELSRRLREQAEASGALLRPSRPVERIDCARRCCYVGEEAVSGGALVLATGLSARQLGVPGEAELAARGLRHRPSREPLWFRGKRVAVVGGGDRAAENALLLGSVAREVHLLYRGGQLRARAGFVELLQAACATSLHPLTTVTAIRFSGDEVLVDIGQPGGPGTLTLDAICIYIGNRPNTDLVEGQVDLTEAGYLVTDRNGRSSVLGIYGVGDVCTPPEYQSLTTAAGQAMVVAKHIALSGGVQ